ncbi:MAG TPA: TetR/AcrR family transcriptional regulator [Tepidisphaeraceae bacterium]|nr:TetR/AcrR family transcriptional regulator [Tepidisphaeraceae bacterium]
MKASAAKTRPRRREYTQTARAEAAQETGRRIVDAFVDRLVSGWFDEITLDRIADVAGVTVQTIIRRFGGKEGLLGDAVTVLKERITAQRGAPAGDVDTMVRNLYADYERTGDAVMRVLALELRHPVVTEITNAGRREHRLWVADAMAPALNKVPSGSQRHRFLDELVIVTDVYTWKLLRRDMRHSLLDSTAIATSMVHAVVASHQ